ncbi:MULTISPECIES: hypothetical protein [Colwellia]|nr:hypothetical protein [Colwellia sp. D2M02]
MSTKMLLLLVSFNFYAYATSPPIINITIEADIYDYTQEILAGKSPLEIDDFSGEHAQRDVIEVILVQQALALGGIELNFQFTTGHYDSRNIRLLQQGLLLINFDSMWLSSVERLQEDIYISDPLIRKGEYWAGLYTSVEKVNTLKINSLADLQQLTITSNKHWPVDWETLSKIKPKKLIHQEEWVSMAKLVSLGWIDIMLAPFTHSKPFSYQGEQYKIMAIEGVKIALNDSRHIIVSKKHPYGERTFNALQKGLKILRKRGTITKAYQQSGFFNEQVKNWHIINAEMLND